MAVTFYSKITLRPGSVFCFETISSVADEEGILHRIADPPEKKSPPTNSKNAGEAQPRALRKKIVSGKSGAEDSLTRRTPPSTSPTKEWTQIAKKKETREKQVVLSVPPASKETGKKVATTAAPFYPDVLFIGRVESPTVSDDEPTAPGEEPPQRESRRRRNRRRNVRRHHAAGERDPEQPVSRDEVSEIRETPEERVFRERRNSRRRDRRRAQEQAEQDARQRRENPFFGRNLNPDFARAMNTPSEVGGVLARIADGLPRTPDAEGYRRLFTQATNHLLPLAHPPIHVHVGRPGLARHRPIKARPTKARPTKAHIQLWAVPCQHVCPVIGPRHGPQLVMCARPAQIAQNVLMCQTGPYTYNSNTSTKSIIYI
jgi:hypothetical protein